MSTPRLRAAAFAAVLSFSAAAQAGRGGENTPPTVSSIQRSMALAERTAARLDASGAQVVVLARAGQNLSEYGVRDSHLGFAYREGKLWRVVHKLNQCGTASGLIYRQGLAEFFLDDPYG